MLEYYDDALKAKIEKWLPQEGMLRVLNSGEEERLFETKADDTGDKPIALPMISLSRSSDMTILSNVKQERSFSGLRLGTSEKTDKTAVLNVIPVQLDYQLDVWAKKREEADEYVRELLFKLINNPLIEVAIPYQGAELAHVANVRVDTRVSDSSSSARRAYPGQFYRYSMNLEIQDAFLFNVAYKKNWRIVDTEVKGFKAGCGC